MKPSILDDSLSRSLSYVSILILAIFCCPALSSGQEYILRLKPVVPAKRINNGSTFPQPPSHRFVFPYSGSLDSTYRSEGFRKISTPTNSKSLIEQLWKTQEQSLTRWRKSAAIKKEAKAKFMSQFMQVYDAATVNAKDNAIRKQIDKNSKLYLGKLSALEQATQVQKKLNGEIQEQIKQGDLKSQKLIAEAVNSLPASAYFEQMPDALVQKINKYIDQEVERRLSEETKELNGKIDALNSRFDKLENKTGDSKDSGK